jgi:hypothetical protein
VLLPPPWAQISPTAPYSQTSSQPLPLMWKTKFHTHIKQTKLSVYINLHIIRQEPGRQKILDQTVAGIPWI